MSHHHHRRHHHHHSHTPHSHKVHHPLPHMGDHPPDHSSATPVSSSSSAAAPYLFSDDHLNSSPSSSSKIPFRPRKIRKTSEDPPDTKPKPSSSAPTTMKPLTRMIPASVARPLSSEGEIALALRHLSAVDPELARVIDTHESPSFQSLYQPFHSLARSILYQQLAMKAAASIYGRFLSLCGGESNVVPEAVLALTPHQLRQIGVSARKASYLHDLASKYCGGILSDAAIVAMDDKSLFSMLTMVKGIGAWSVHMFMIFSLHRPDVIPVGDLGVRKGVQILYNLDELPRPSQMEQLCDKWRPYRSVGSWYMWRLLENKPPPPALLPAGQHQQHQQLLDPVNSIMNLG